MKRSLAIFAVLMVTGAVVLTGTPTVPVQPAQAAGCDVLRYGGDSYAFHKHRVRCHWAKRKAKRLHRTQGSEEPRRFNCSSGSNFRTGGSCEHRSKNKTFGWHPFD